MIIDYRWYSDRDAEYKVTKIDVEIEDGEVMSVLRYVDPWWIPCRNSWTYEHEMRIFCQIEKELDRAAYIESMEDLRCS